jgi:glycerol uptake facilitator-like aquaporin
MDTTKYVAEFIGTFAFVLAIFLIVDWFGTKNQITLAVAIGAALAVVIWVALYFGGDAHVNPAFTVAKIYAEYNQPGHLLNYVAYIGAQVVGALAAFYVHDATRK